MRVEPHGSQKYTGSVLLASSCGRAWPTIGAELRAHEPCETPVIPRTNLEICFAVVGNENSLVRRTGAGQHQETFALTGTAWLSPVEVGDNVLTITKPIPKGLHLYLSAPLFARLRDDFNLPNAPARSIRYVAGIRDSVISAIAHSILSEMTNQTSAGDMYVETASLMLAAHLIRDYSDIALPHRATEAAPAIDRLRISQILGYISDNVANKITVEELATVSGLSTFHFARMFARAVGTSPSRYVSRLRLEQAMTEIRAGRLSLAQIALNAGFSSQASFTRAFFRATGVTPGKYRQTQR